MIYGYTRVSTTEQASDDRTSLAEQERRCRAAAVLRGQEIAEVFSDPGVSGSMPLFRRPGGQQLLAVLKEGDTVISAKMDRIFRSTSDALQSVEQLQKKGVGVVLVDIGPDPVTENGTSKLFFSILASVAEFERFRISERISDGRMGKTRRGGFIGGEPPYGWSVRGKGSQAVLVENEHERRIIGLADELSHRMSVRGVCRELNRRGLVGRSGGPFHPETVNRMLNRVRGR